MDFRYVRILAHLYFFSLDTTTEKPVADFFAVFHAEILAKEMRELVNRIISEIEDGIRAGLRCGDHEDEGVKIILHISGDHNHSYIHLVRPYVSTEGFDDSCKAVNQFLLKLSNDLYPTLSSIADIERHMLPANPDLSTLTENLKTQKYEIRHND